MSEKIRAWVFEFHGEKLGEKGLSFSRCPGMECSSFRVAAGKTWAEKAIEACTNCQKCNGNFPLDPSEQQEPDMIEQIILDVREIYERHEAGCSFNFDSAGFVKGALFLAFDKAVKEVEKLHSTRMQVFLKGWMK